MLKRRSIWAGIKFWACVNLFELVASKLKCIEAAMNLLMNEFRRVANLGKKSSSILAAFYLASFPPEFELQCRLKCKLHFSQHLSQRVCKLHLSCIWALRASAWNYFVEVSCTNAQMHRCISAPIWLCEFQHEIFSSLQSRLKLFISAAIWACEF